MFDEANFFFFFFFYHRSTIKQECSSHLVILPSHKDGVDALDVEELANIFSSCTLAKKNIFALKLKFAFF